MSCAVDVNSIVSEMKIGDQAKMILTVVPGRVIIC